MVVDPRHKGLVAIEGRVYPTAAGNMMRDRVCLQAGQPCVRFIEWPQASVTYPDARPLLGEWPGLDHSARPTGGGVLLHSPGSLVLSMVIPLVGKESFKRYLGLVQEWAMGVLAQVGVDVERGSASGVNMAYCTTYHNPYEIRFRDEKVMALAVKKDRSACLIQGIIHTVSNEGFFDGWGVAMTKGLGQSGIASSDLNRAFCAAMPPLLNQVYTH